MGGRVLGAVLKAADLGHVLAQVDEEAALEQAVKFCQVHLGAAAQRQVSVDPPVPAAWWRVRGPRLQARTIPVVGGPRAGGRQAAEPRALSPGGTQTPAPSAGGVRVPSPPQLSSKPEHGRRPMNLACRSGSSAWRWRWGGPTGAHGWGPVSIQPPSSGKTPAAGCGGRARAGPAQVTLEGGAGRRLVAGSWGRYLSWGRCGLSVPRAGLAAMPQRQEDRDPTLTSAHGTQVLSHPPSRWRSTGVAGSSTPMEPGMGRLPGSRCQERRGQGGVLGAPRRREAPAASGQGPTGDSERTVALRPGLCRWAPRGAPPHLAAACAEPQPSPPRGGFR